MMKKKKQATPSILGEGNEDEGHDSYDHVIHDVCGKHILVDDKKRDS